VPGEFTFDLNARAGFAAIPGKGQRSITEEFTLDPDAAARLGALVDATTDSVGQAIVHELLRLSRDEVEWAPRAILGLAYEGALQVYRRQTADYRQAHAAALTRMRNLLRRLSKPDSMEAGYALLKLAERGATIHVAARFQPKWRLPDTPPPSK
jgi:hypothetical protein